jgi:hypothetical protein
VQITPTHDQSGNFVWGTELHAKFIGIIQAYVQGKNPKNKQILALDSLGVYRAIFYKELLIGDYSRDILGEDHYRTMRAKLKEQLKSGLEGGYKGEIEKIFVQITQFANDHKKLKSCINENKENPAIFVVPDVIKEKCQKLQDIVFPKIKNDENLANIIQKLDFN